MLVVSRVELFEIKLKRKLLTWLTKLIPSKLKQFAFLKEIIFDYQFTDHKTKTKLQYYNIYLSIGWVI